MDYIGLVLGYFLGPRRRDPQRLFRMKDDVHERLTTRLLEYSSPETEISLRHKKNGFQASYGSKIGPEDFQFHVQAVLGDDGLESSRLVYQTVIAFGQFPFPPAASQEIDWQTLVQAIAMLQTYGQTAMHRPRFCLPRTEWVGEHTPRYRKRESREQLRLLFQVLATGSPPSSKSTESAAAEDLPDKNEDLLDALAVGMDLGDDRKFLYFAKHFDEALSTLPSSESDRQLDAVLPWRTLETFLETLDLAAKQSKVRFSRQWKGDPDSQDEVEQLMQHFRSASGPEKPGVGWPVFLQSMKSQVCDPSPREEGKEGKERVGYALQAFYLCILQICESILSASSG